MGAFVPPDFRGLQNFPDAGHKETAKPMFKLFRLLKPYAPPIAAVLVLLFGSALADLSLPTLMANIVDLGVAKSDFPYIYHTGALMLSVAVGGIACALVSSLVSARVALGFARTVRLQVFTRVESFSFYEFDKIGTASLITRTTNDVNQVQQSLIMMLGILVRAPIMGVGGVVMAVTRNRGLSVVLLVAIPLLALALFLIASRGVPLFREMQKKLDQLNLVIREKLVGIRVVRAFDRVAHEEARFDAANADLTGTGLKLAKLMNLMMPLIMVIMNFTVIALVWFGSLRVEAGGLQVGDIMAFIQYAFQILFSLMMVSMLFIMIPRAQVSAVRINEVLDMKPEIRNPDQAAGTGTKKGFVAFEHVGFKYRGAEEPALTDVSFEAGPGEVTAVIGSTGSGKTTLAGLVPRFYDAGSGVVRVDGVDIRNLDQEVLRQKIGFVPQTTTLFTGSVRDNLRFGREDVADEALREAAKTAQAWEFISGLDGGLDAFLAQGGANLSGGQKQRLAIARALVRRPEIYIFDDSFSALDFKTDAALRAALKKETREATILLVAQRVTTVLDADRIVVLNEGRVEGIGRHAELMHTCAVYREIVSSQLSPEELS
jgi:ATP-binding cassette, subfamily B, multidrug efflux pump